MKPSDLKKLYEQMTGNSWSDDVGAAWLRKNDEIFWDFIYTKTPVLEKTAYIDLSDKANWLSQLHCRVCRPDFPISTLPIRIRPESWQAINSIDKVAFKKAIAASFSDFEIASYKNGRICLLILFVCSSRRRNRDIDNMAKLLVDSIKGVLMGDDRNVDHLNLMRLTHEAEEEYVTLHISGSNLNTHEDVVVKKLFHSWAGMKLLRIEDFRKGT